MSTRLSSVRGEKKEGRFELSHLLSPTTGQRTIHARELMTKTGLFLEVPREEKLCSSTRS